MAGLSNKTALITGGTGFIGSHLAEKLADLGAKVIVLDISINPKSYFIVNKVHKKVIFDLVDIRDKELVLKTFKKYSPDYVFHLAAEPIVEAAYSNPHSAFETNVMGTVNVLEAIRSLKSVKKVLVTSSDKAYGKTEEPYVESSPLKGDHPYDVSKSAQDLIAQTYVKTYGLPIVITRFGNVYGEGDIHLSRLIPGICEAIIRNKTFEIRSNGKYIRDYLYVKDVVDGCILLMNKFEEVVGESFNFSSNETLSVLSVLRNAEKILKTKVQFKILNRAINEIPYQHLIDKKVRKLGWKNNHSFSSTFPGILEWYSKIYQ